MILLILDTDIQFFTNDEYIFTKEENRGLLNVNDVSVIRRNNNNKELLVDFLI